MTDLNTLSPCPFCGNDGTGPIKEALHLCEVELEWKQGIPYYTIQCDKCSATMGYSETEAEAIAAWTNLPTPAPQEKSDE